MAFLHYVVHTHIIVKGRFVLPLLIGTDDVFLARVDIWWYITPRCKEPATAEGFKCNMR